MPHVWHHELVGVFRPIEVARRTLAAHGHLSDQLSEPSPGAVHAVAAIFSDCITELNRSLGLDEDAASRVLSVVLPAASQAFVLFRHGQFDQASRSLVWAWEAHLRTLRLPGVAEWEARRARAFLKPEDLDPEWLALWNLAVSDHLAARLGGGRARHALQRLSTHLQLGQDELGRMFGVAGETVRRWLLGSHRVPAGRAAEIGSADAALTRLLELFRPGRLSQVIRRQADLFGGERAVDWILRGRITEVADRYEAALAYQG